MCLSARPRLPFHLSPLMPPHTKFAVVVAVVAAVVIVVVGLF